MPGKPDIARLTARMAKGDEAAYREFFELFFNRLLRYLLVLNSGDEAAARDALQATMLRVARHVRRFDHEDALWSWLTVLARSSVVDAERKKKRYFGLLERFFEREPAHSTGTDETEERMAEVLARSLGALTEEDRELVERKYFEGESVREIAEALGASVKSVESRLVRVRRELKNLILRDLKNER
jgi:RNA polymerase sigma-70 factor, ECF subfamily